MKALLRKGLLASIFTLCAIGGSSQRPASPFLQDTTANNYPYPETLFSPQTEKRYDVHIPPKTREFLSAETIEILENTAIRETFILSPADLIPIENKINSALSPFYHGSGMRVNPSNMFSSIRNEKAAQIEALFPRLALYKKEIFAGVYDAAANHFYSAAVIPNSNFSAYACVIIVPEPLSADKKLSALARTRLESSIGSPEKWAELILIHEAFHCNDNVLAQTYDDIRTKNENVENADYIHRDNASINTEFNAGQYVIHFLNMQLALGREEYRGMREAFIASRLIGIFNRDFEPHAHAGFLSLGHDANIYIQNADHIRDTTQMAIARVQYRVGEKFMSPSLRAITFRGALWEHFKEMPIQPTTEQEKERRNKYQRQLRALDKKLAEYHRGEATDHDINKLVIQGLWNEGGLSGVFRKHLIRATLNLGLEKIREDNYHAYEAISHFDRWGGFLLSNKDERELFLRTRMAYERYAPQHMKPKQEATMPILASAPTPKV